MSDVRFSKQLDTGTSSEITQADVEQLRSIGRKSIFEFTSEDIQKSEKWAKNFYSELGTKSPFFRAWFGDWRENDTGKTNVVTVPTIDISDAVLEYGDYHIKDTDWDVYAGRTLKDDTTHHSGGERINVKSLNSINSILENAVLLDTVVSENNTNKKAKYTAFLHKLYTPIIYNSKEYLAVTTVEEYYDESKNGVSRRAYNLKNIKIESADGRLEKISTSPMSDTDSTISISDLYALVKGYDKDFKSQPSSKVVNTDGTPKVVYHGTNADFWTFSLANRGKNGEKLGVGYYFVDNKSSAERYGDRVVEAYLDIKKPASAEVMEISRKDWEKFLDFAIEHRDEYIEGEWKGNEINKEYELTDFDYGSNDAELIKGFLNGIAAGNKDVTEAYLEMLKDSTGYDGIAYNTDNTDYYVAFTPEQIKSATDNIGTFDKDNKDIRYSKELMTAEEKKKVREAERAAYLERQLVSTAPLGGKAKAVSPTAKAAVAKKIASGMPGVSTAQVNEQLTKFDAYNHIKSLTAIYVLFTLFCRRKCVCVVYSGFFSTRILIECRIVLFLCALLIDFISVEQLKYKRTT